MSWSQYVRTHAGDDLNRVVAERTGVSEPNVSRWKNSGQTPRAEHVAAFARSYHRPVLEAFIAAGFLTPEEARARPAAAPDYSQLSNDELLKLVRERMREDGGSGGDTAAKTPAGLDPAPDAVVTESMTPDERPAGGASPGPTRKTRGQGRRG